MAIKWRQTLSMLPYNLLLQNTAVRPSVILDYGRPSLITGKLHQALLHSVTAVSVKLKQNKIHSLDFVAHDAFHVDGVGPQVTQSHTGFLLIRRVTTTFEVEILHR